MDKFDNTYKLTKITFLLSGIDMRKNARTFVKFIFYFNYLWLYTDVFGEFLWLSEGVRVGRSFDELSMIVPCMAICILATVRTIPLYYNRNIIISVYDKLREIHPKEEESFFIDDSEASIEDTDGKDQSESTEDGNFERDASKNATTTFKNVLRFMVTANTSVVLAFCFLPLLLMGLDFQKTGETELKLPFFVKYFFDPYAVTAWPFVYLHHIWSTCIVIVNLFCADTFYHGFCIYLKMQFKILCHNIQKSVTNSKKETDENLRVCILRHQELISLVDKMEELYSKSFLFNIVMSSVLICLGGFNIVFINEFDTVFAFVNFLTMCLFQIFMLCFFGEMIVNSSSDVKNAVFNTKWYDADAGAKKSLLLILLRSQKPCSLTAFFTTINLSTFTTILSRSWSYFALLRTMYN